MNEISLFLERFLHSVQKECSTERSVVNDLVKPYPLYKKISPEISGLIFLIFLCKIIY